MPTYDPDQEDDEGLDFLADDEEEEPEPEEEYDDPGSADGELTGAILRRLAFDLEHSDLPPIQTERAKKWIATWEPVLCQLTVGEFKRYLEVKVAGRLVHALSGSETRKNKHRKGPGDFMTRDQAHYSIIWQIAQAVRTDVAQAMISGLDSPPSSYS